MKVELKVGESVSVVFAETDGEIIVDFGETAIEVRSELPDTAGRVGVIYREAYDEPVVEDLADVLRAPPPREKDVALETLVARWRADATRIRGHITPASHKTFVAEATTTAATLEECAESLATSLRMREIGRY